MHEICIAGFSYPDENYYVDLSLISLIIAHMKYVVIIEIGTNSIKALTAAVNAEACRIMSDEVFPVRPGQGLAVSGNISEEAQQRILQTVSRIKQAKEAVYPCEFHVIATESLRKAANAELLIELIQRTTKCDTTILDQQEEAKMSFLAGTLDSSDSEEAVAVLDIGGGSTELTVGCKRDILISRSLPLGAVRLTEQYIRHDPISEQELISLKFAIAGQLDILGNLPQAEKLVGIGGTITTLALLRQPELSMIHGMQLSLDYVQQRIGEFSGLDNEQRKSLPGMPAGRADIILAGSLILEQIMLCLNQTDLFVCSRGVRHGYLYSLHCQAIS
jgi:exopolyphosphatase/guanosine-5'-triphosphate,3'-diphosphate pyrophosphatase